MKARVEHPRIAFLGRFGTGNLGNECTLSALLGAARRFVPGAALEVICHAPADVERLHGVPAEPIGFARDTGRAPRLPRLLRVPRRIGLELKDLAAALEVMWRQDALVVAGTGCVTDADDGPLGFPWQLFKWCHAARVLGKSVVFVGVGVEGVTTRLGRALLLASLRSAEYRGFRDRQSVEKLARLGLEVSRDVVAPDVAFSLGRSEVGGRRSEGRAVVGVGLYGGNGRDEPVPGYTETMAAFVEWLVARGHRVRLVIGDVVYDSHARERVLEALDRRRVDRSRVADALATSFDEVLSQLDAVDLLVASRFHNLALGLLLGKPAASISYDPKNEALLEDVGLGAFCQTLPELRLERLQQHFLSLEENAPALARGVQEKVRTYREALEAQLGRVFGAIALARAARD